MRGLVFLLLSASRLLGQGQGLAIPSPEEALDREHYGVKIRDILDHIYGKPPLQRRSEEEGLVSECRPGSTPHYQDGTLTACSFETSIESYNKAIRDIHTKRTRRSLEGEPPVYHFKRDWRFNGASAGNRYQINGGGHPNIVDSDEAIPLPQVSPKNGDPMQLPPNWTFNLGEGGCYNSGTWAKLEEMAKIREPWCRILHENRNIVAIKHMTFFKARLDPINPGRLLKNSEGRTMAINTEYVSHAYLPGDNEVYSLCMIATKGLLEGPCHGENQDTRGGWQVVQRENLETDQLNEYERSVSFGWDPQTGPECC
ncbi:hypothetical protein TWF718_007218 [Orbilia javanica]|uniref:Uncharacterized protein n=1 Tax=Orbilia javanica TaxID=47235 RepID=A0AAN8RI86_9PEZI